MGPRPLHAIISAGLRGSSRRTSPPCSRRRSPACPPPPAPQVFVPRLRLRDSDFRNRGLSGSLQVESGVRLGDRAHRILWGIDGSKTKQTRNEDFSQFDGTTGAFTVLAGTLLPLKCIRVNSTTTTATLMNALYQV